MSDIENGIIGTPDQGTPYVNLDSDVRSIISDFEVNINQVGHGSFGKVYKSTYQDEEGKIIEVAVKKINIRSNEGFPLSAIREITILKKYRHKNLVPFINSFVDPPKPNKKGNVSLVYEYAQHDLASLIKENIDFDLDCIKSIMLQILSGVKYIHDNYILHRDIKPANILIKNKGEVKLADFGLSRFFEKRKNQWRAYTNSVVTLWYRAPELLLSECYYKTSIDMWSVGCVMAELFTKQPLFKEQNALKQISAIFSLIGRPKEEDLIRYYKINEGNLEFQSILESLMPESGEVIEFDKKLIEMDKTGYLKECKSALELIIGLLTFNVNKRLTADQALNHEFFKGMDYDKAVNILSKKFQEDKFKNKEFHEKVIYVKKNEGLVKEMRSNIENNNERYYCNVPKERKGHIIKKMEGYDLEENKMEEEPNIQKEQEQNWNNLDDFMS